MDYAFCRHHDEEHVTTMLVMKHRQSRAVRCWVVPQKGAVDLVATEIVEGGLKAFGITGDVILKTDNEDAINALRRRVQALHPGAALEQTPAAYGHESNGVIENGNRMGKGLLRVLLLALEARIGGVSRAPTPCSPGLPNTPAISPRSTLWERTARLGTNDSLGSLCMRRGSSSARSCGGAPRPPATMC